MKIPLEVKHVGSKLDKELLVSLIQEELDKLIHREAKKKSKKNCSPGNVWHDGRGRLTDKSNAKVYSLKFMSGGSDCKRGQARQPGQRFLKRPCGRKEKHGGGKEPFKCKDGSRVEESESEWITDRENMPPSLAKKKRNNALYPGHNEMMTLSKGIVEQEEQQTTGVARDFVNCKLLDFSKDYELDKKTGKRMVNISREWECEYTAPMMDQEQQQQMAYLAQQQGPIGSGDVVRIKKPMFDRFMQWLDKNPKQKKKERLPDLE